MCIGGIAVPAKIRAEQKTEAVQQQQKVLKGTVADGTGPVIGATVIVVGKTIGAVTDENGNFTLSGVANSDVIRISYLGYASQDIVYSGQPSINVLLTEDSKTLGEVVVTALGIKRESKALGYAISTIGGDELIKSNSPNFATALYGKAAGVRIQAAPGGAASAVSINVRGLSSITGNNQPLVIMDGVPVRNGNANNDGYWGDQRINSNGLVDINTEDIASLSILKGASATALYGSEAANGVIMITTKSGQRGSGYSIDLSASVSADVLAYMPEMQTIFGPGAAVQSRNNQYQIESGGFWQRTLADGTTVKSVQTATAQFGPKYDGSPVYYWDGKMRPYSPISSNPWKDIFRTGLNQTYNLGITHGNENSNMRFSYTAVNNTPMQYNSDFQKNNFNLAGNIMFNKALSLSYSANYMREFIKNRPYRISRLTNNFSGMFGSFLDTRLMREMTVTSLGYKNVFGTSPTLTPNESFAYDAGSSALVDEYYWNILGRERLENRNRLIGSVAPTWTISEGLQLRGRLSTDLSADKIETKERTERSLALGDPTGYYALGNERYEIYYGDIMLNFNRKLTEKIGLNANVGYQGRMEQQYNTQVYTSGGLTVENWFNINASRNKAEQSNKKMELLKTAYFGTLGLSYGDFAYLEGTARQEQTSTLAPGNNSFFYPSVNASLIYTDMLRDQLPSWYSYGKVRASYAIVGNAPDVYLANQAYNQKSLSGFTYNRTMDDVGNDNLKPETKYEWEFGIENKFFGNRLGFEVSYYTARVKDQILKTTTPYSSGANSILLNIGELENKGVEIVAYGTPYRTGDWEVNLNANIAFQRNKVVKLMDGFDNITHSNYDSGAAELRSYVGQPMGDIYACVPYTDPATGKRVVSEDDGMYLIDMTGMKKVGNAMPKALGGFGGSVSWKGLTLDCLFDFRIGGAVLNTPYEYMMGRGNLIESLPYRDAEHGGMNYYFENNDNVNGRRIAHGGSTGPNGERVYDNGLILDAMKGKIENGKLVVTGVNDVIAPSDRYYNWTYNWGAGDPTHYQDAIFDNSYLKLREITLSYRLPQSFTQKFACKNLIVSAYGRNLAFLYKNLPSFDAEATDGTSWISQAQIGGSTATSRSFGLSLRMQF